MRPQNAASGTDCSRAARETTHSSEIDCTANCESAQVPDLGHSAELQRAPDQDLAADALKPTVASAETPDVSGAPNAAMHDPSADQATIARLAALAPLEYDRLRKSEAEVLGVRVETLDGAVRKARGEAEPEEAAGKEAMFPELDPWPEQVNGATLLDELATTFSRFVVLPQHGGVALALWVIFTHAIDVAQTAPILALTSPEMGCGKTTLMDLLTRLTRRAWSSSNISPSAVFRSIEKWQPTLLIDEGDSFLRDSEPLRGILNSGHTRATACVVRIVGDDFEPQRFSTWSAKAIALIGKLPATLTDRSIVIELRRKLKHEKVEKLRYADPAMFERLRRRCQRFSADHVEALKLCRPNIPHELRDRAADNWEPLFAIADIAGGDWPTMAREAAKALSDFVGHSDSAQVELLRDMRELFETEGIERLASEGLVDALCADETRRWATYDKGKRISQRHVAALLGKFGIVPGTIRIANDKTLRGYLRVKCEDAFARYLPPLEVQHRHNGHVASLVAESASTTGTDALHFANPSQPASSLACGGVTDENPSTAGELEIPTDQCAPRSLLASLDERNQPQKVQ